LTAKWNRLLVREVKRKRKVFGRRRVNRDGTVFLVAMHKDRVTVRELWARRTRTILLGDLVDMAMGQRVFPFNG
jgi:hypothetical protein